MPHLTFNGAFIVKKLDSALTFCAGHDLGALVENPICEVSSELKTG